MKNNQLGTYGEQLAEKFLKKRGYKIIEKNFKTKHGEIDIIAKHKKDIVFVEVRLRYSSAFGSAAESVDYSKQQKIIKSAICYLKTNNLTANNIRFDVVAIDGIDEKIDLIESAFDVDGDMF
jgi:putative endonuclease